MKRTFLTVLQTVLVFSVLFLIGCKQEDKLLSGSSLNAPNRFPIYLSPSDYTEENTYYLLNDDEPSSVFFDPNQRSFYVDEPIQLTFDDDHYFQLRFYSPRALPNVTIWAKMAGYEEQFKLVELEKLMPFQQLRLKLAFATENITAQTRSGKTIKIMANPHLAGSDLSFEIECDAPYYQTLQSIKSHCRIRFQNFSQLSPGTYGDWPLRAYQAREGVAIALNMMYMFSSPEFEAELKAWGPLYSNTNVLVDKDVLIKQPVGHGELKFGCVHRGSIGGLGNGGIFCLADHCFYEHYADDASSTENMFHEFAHCIGYLSHAGNMTYGNGTLGWTALCNKVYVELSVAKKLPIYSRRFMHTRKTAKNQYTSNTQYRASAHIIEDPELDEIDGGLAPTGTTDLNGENGNALSFSMDYTAVPGATATTFRPKDVYVYNDTMYVVNDAKDNYSLEIFNIKDGKVSHLKSIREWTRADGATEHFLGEPNGVTQANGKIYVTHTGSRTEVFDAADQSFITCLGTGSWGASATQTVHAFDVVLHNGMMLIHDKRYLVVAEERMLGLLNPMLVFARSENLGEVAGTYGMAVDTVNNILYTTHPANRIDLFDLSAIREYQEIKRSGNFTYKNSPYALDFYDKKLYVSSNGDEKFCEVDPETGAILKNYTTIGGITLQAPEKFCIRRKTLFIIDRIADGVRLYAIPMSELK